MAAQNCWLHSTDMTQITGFVFPGQGSQQVGMLAELTEKYAVARETFVEASEVLGFDLAGMITDGPAEQLNETANTQPALLAAGVAVWRVWVSLGGVRPSCMAGHSLGEYTALVCAGALDFADGLKVVRLRGQYMQQSVPAGVGGMAAIIGLDDDTVLDICSKAAQEQVVEAVNFNAPGQVVVAGHAEAVEQASSLAKEAGARMVAPLPVSVPSHCSLMIPAAEKLAAALMEISVRLPNIPVLHNSSVAMAESPEELRSRLVEQLHKPVRWVETIQSMMTDYHIEQFAECGPGKVLSGLNKRIARRVPVAVLGNVAALEQLAQGGE